MALILDLKKKSLFKIMERLGCITKGHRHLVLSLLLAVEVQMHENCMTSQMWINNKGVKEIFFPPPGYQICLVCI